ncbi:hypothetical protein MPDQ_006760 [Monascus purpureus]|uniref:DUF676 domain-containing protein n=1 Tax=Monascus purpureus TaxID=5098 RepID=A0A507QX90_MONPU|nr:hypothetical protein MPDQ_006760 [Monascus purpureus]
MILTHVASKISASPKHPIVLAHGLLGFDELRPAGPYFPAVQYWRGIREALKVKGIDVVTASVPPSGTIQQRAKELERCITTGACGKNVNIIAHSMVRCILLLVLLGNLLTIVSRGLDARYMISRLRPTGFKVLSLTTIATPHRGSAIADYVLDHIGDERLPQVYYFLNRINIETGAFAQLTQKYMVGQFNPQIPDVEDVRYFSYGAVVQPGMWSLFRLSQRILQHIEGPNDGLVSVASSKWGTYEGTLLGVSHLDLINWTNRLKWLAGELTGNKQKFNAIAFYLDIADTLAKEGL